MLYLSALEMQSPNIMTAISMKSIRERIKDYTELNLLLSFGGLEVECWPLVPKFAGSNPAEAVGFFRAKKSSARLPSEGK